MHVDPVETVLRTTSAKNCNRGSRCGESSNHSENRYNRVFPLQYCRCSHSPPSTRRRIKSNGTAAILPCPYEKVNCPPARNAESLAKLPRNPTLRPGTRAFVLLLIGGVRQSSRHAVQAARRATASCGNRLGQWRCNSSLPERLRHNAGIRSASAAAHHHTARWKSTGVRVSRGRVARHVPFSTFASAAAAGRVDVVCWVAARSSAASCLSPAAPIPQSTSSTCRSPPAAPE